MIMQLPPEGHIGTQHLAMTNDAPRHAMRIVAIALERDGGAPALNRAAQRQITARRLASGREPIESGR